MTDKTSDNCDGGGAGTAPDSASVTYHRTGDAALDAALTKMLGDPNSPQRRLQRYWEEESQSRTRRCTNIIAFSFYNFVPLMVLEGRIDANNLWVVPLITVSVLLAVDIVVSQCYRFERWYFCPRYDKASQPKPDFDLGEGLGRGRVFIYFAFVPLLPTSVLWVLGHFSFVSLKPWPYEWFVGLKLAALLILAPLLDWPVSIRMLLKPFRRVRSPDVN
jgi:hypothetical protein